MHRRWTLLKENSKASIKIMRCGIKFYLARISEVCSKISYWIAFLPRAPFVLPELKYVTEVTLMDDRYHGFSFKAGKNWDELQVGVVTISYLYFINHKCRIIDSLKKSYSTSTAWTLLSFSDFGEIFLCNQNLNLALKLGSSVAYTSLNCDPKYFWDKVNDSRGTAFVLGGVRGGVRAFGPRKKYFW